MTDVIRKTYFYQDAQIKEYHLNKPIDQKIWFRTADTFFDLAHSLTDSIAKNHPLYKPAIRMDELVKASDPVIHHTFDLTTVWMSSKSRCRKRNFKKIKRNVSKCTDSSTGL